jgi:nitrite reductase/ring-hydroxylating ferredoxin subunit/uncharacterized membrane protein
MMRGMHDVPEWVASHFGGPADQLASVLEIPGRRLNVGFLRDMLSGTPLGHPLHPALTDVAIGSWSSAVLVDLTGERGADAARRLVGLGVLAAIPTALSGWSDWLDTKGDQRRVGAIHAAGNAVVTGLFLGSWVARSVGKRRAGVGLAALGASLAGATAYLGGHLVYAEGVGVDVTTFETVPKRWTRVAELEEVPDGDMTVADLEGVPILLVRTGDSIAALHDRCTHRGGPLHRGTLEEGTVTCPWHGSCFRTDDGAIVHGPASIPQRRLDCRVRDGGIEVRRGVR